eukprot:5548805-Prymnesium_polylepis.1
MLSGAPSEAPSCGCGMMVAGMLPLQPPPRSQIFTQLPRAAQGQHRLHWMPGPSHGNAWRVAGRQLRATRTGDVTKY